MGFEPMFSRCVPFSPHSPRALAYLMSVDAFPRSPASTNVQRLTALSLTTARQSEPQMTLVDEFGRGHEAGTRFPQRLQCPFATSRTYLPTAAVARFSSVALTSIFPFRADTSACGSAASIRSNVNLSATFSPANRSSTPLAAGKGESATFPAADAWATADRTVAKIVPHIIHISPAPL